jgi:hypothetical protein
MQQYCINLLKLTDGQFENAKIKMQNHKSKSKKGGFKSKDQQICLEPAGSPGRQLCPMFFLI